MLLRTVIENEIEAETITETSQKATEASLSGPVDSHHLDPSLFGGSEEILEISERSVGLVNVVVVTDVVSGKPAKEESETGRECDELTLTHLAEQKGRRSPHIDWERGSERRSALELHLMSARTRLISPWGDLKHGESQMRSVERALM